MKAHFNPRDYIRYVELSGDLTLQQYMRDELEFILGVENINNRTFVDLGAGYGRVFNRVYPYVAQYIGMDANRGMLKELEMRVAPFPNCEAFCADITSPPEQLESKIEYNPIIGILQNTLGTLEGNLADMLTWLKKFSQINNGTVVLSLFRQEMLKDWGTGLYQSMEPMVGPMDEEKTDYDEGLFVSETGYTSKWWKNEEIHIIIAELGLKVKRQHWEPSYALIELNP